MVAGRAGGAADDHGGDPAGESDQPRPLPREREAAGARPEGHTQHHRVEEEEGQDRGERGRPHHGGGR